MEESWGYESDEGDNLSSQILETYSIQCENLFVNTVIPTLQSIAAVSSAIRLWTEEDVIEILLQGYGYNKSEERVLDKITKSSIPDLFKTEISKFIRPVGLQLVEWYNEKNREYCSLRDLRIMDGTARWTMEGTIDKVKILEDLITNEYPNKAFCCLYCLACKYCLEEYVFDLWGILSSESKKEIESIFLGNDYENDIIAYWTFIAKNESSLMLEIVEINKHNIYNRNFNLNENMISWSVFVGNPFALKYFWRKLTEEEKNAKIRLWLDDAAKYCSKSYGVLSKYNYLDYNPYTENLCFLLSHIRDRDQQREFLRKKLRKIMRLLFQSWPFQKNFVPVALVMMEYIKKDLYLSLLGDIIREMEKEKTARKIFTEIWICSPRKLKKRFLKENMFILNEKFPIVSTLVRVLLKFLKIGDTDNALRLVRDASEFKKKWIVSIVDQSGDFYDYVYKKNDLSLLDILFKEILPSDKDLPSLKRRIVLSYTDLGICMDWKSMGDVQAMDEFLAWGLKSKEEIRDFKENYLNPFSWNDSIARVHDVLNLRFESGEEIIRFRRELSLRW